MSYKSENWKEKLEQVRNHIALKEGSVEKSADEILNDQIEEELNAFEEDVEIVEETLEEKEMARHEVLISKVFKTKKPDEIKGIDRLIDMSSMGVVQSMQKQNPKGFLKTVQALGKLKEEVEEVEEVVEEKQTVEKTVEKLTERNMLGRLAKQLQLNEEGKQKMFAYFEKGELKQ